MYHEKEKIIFHCGTWCFSFCSSWLKHTLLKTHTTTYMITEKTVLLLRRNQKN